VIHDQRRNGSERDAGERQIPSALQVKSAMPLISGMAAVI
jgi:hypothetical protein